MNIIPKQYFLSSLVGISFTSLSLALVYCWYKHDDRTKNCVHNARPKLKREIKIKRKCIPALIGKAGLIIKDIQNKSETWINFQDDDLKYSDRTCTIVGTKEGIDLAEAMIENIIADHALIETYEMYVPVEECNRIIGLCESEDDRVYINTQTYANIIVDKTLYPTDNKQKLIINGTASQIADAIHYIESKVLEQRFKEKEVSSYKNIYHRIDTQLATFSFDKVESIDVYVTEIKNVQTICIRLVSENESLLKLHADMADYYKKLENRQQHRLKIINRGDIVAAKCKDDGCWYRAEVLDVYYSYVCVHYIDFGYERTIHQKNILCLYSKFSDLKAQAIECELIFVKIIGDNTFEKKTVEKLKNLIMEPKKEFRARIRGYTRRDTSMGKLYPVNSPRPLIDLFNDKNNLINDLLIRKGYASRCDYTDLAVHLIPWEFSSNKWAIKPYGRDTQFNEFDLSKEIYIHSDDEEHEQRSYKPKLYDRGPKYAIKNDENGGWYSVQNSEDEYYDNKDWYCQNGLEEEYYKNGGWNSDQESSDWGEENDVDCTEYDRHSESIEDLWREYWEGREEEWNRRERLEQERLAKMTEEELEEEMDRKEEAELERQAELEEKRLFGSLFHGGFDCVSSSDKLFFPGSRFIKDGDTLIFDDRPTSERILEKRQQRAIEREKRKLERQRQRQEKKQKENESSDNKNDNENECNKKESSDDLKNKCDINGSSNNINNDKNINSDNKNDQENEYDANNKSADTKNDDKKERDQTEISNHNNDQKKEHDKDESADHKNYHKNKNGISNHRNNRGKQYSTKLRNLELNNSSHLIPAGFESDISDEFDGFELG
ncbi:hypothetical protein HZH68_005646 [Vespula germanica]|uniref:Tudor domain-containing protein n=1 Tax=Vespula germanica TaxID=30212 RepID=A0A834NEH1_VESGE|nr:hypothetical protein HZH68_005646 [Vespula germanica]